VISFLDFYFVIFLLLLSLDDIYPLEEFFLDNFFLLLLELELCYRLTSPCPIKLLSNNLWFLLISINFESLNESESFKALLDLSSVADLYNISEDSNLIFIVLVFYPLLYLVN